MKSVVLLALLFAGSSWSSVNHPATRSKSAKSYRAKRFEAPVGTVSIVISKSGYELSVYDDKGWYATYPVVFGNGSLQDKMQQGDRNTPEGSFHIEAKRVHEKWCRYMSLDYPTKESYQRFNQRKQKGQIPTSASIGGGIGIHGTWPHDDFMIDQYKNWTEGCISMKNDDVKEIYSFTPVGTLVTIKH